MENSLTRCHGVIIGVSRRTDARCNLAAASVIAVPERADPDAVVRTTTFATPFAAVTALTVAIVAMPTTRPTLAGTMVAVDLNNVAA